MPPPPGTVSFCYTTLRASAAGRAGGGDGNLATSESRGQGPPLAAARSASLPPPQKLGWRACPSKYVLARTFSNAASFASGYCSGPQGQGILIRWQAPRNASSFSLAHPARKARSVAYSPLQHAWGWVASRAAPLLRAVRGSWTPPAPVPPPPLCAVGARHCSLHQRDDARCLMRAHSDRSAPTRSGTVNSGRWWMGEYDGDYEVHKW